MQNLKSLGGNKKLKSVGKKIADLWRKMYVFNFIYNDEE